MKTAIIVPTYDRPLMLERFLKSLTQCIFPPDVYIYVIENGSRSGAESVCNANNIERRVQYLHLPVKSKSLALNHVIKSSDADFLIFFDDDITVPSNIVGTYVGAAQRYGKGYFFGGPLVADAEVPCPPIFFRTFRHPQEVGHSLKVKPK
jgi:glycosyltransferase involved in cell wall biosynthesis